MKCFLCGDEVRFPPSRCVSCSHINADTDRVRQAQRETEESEARAVILLKKISLLEEENEKLREELKQLKIVYIPRLIY